MGKILEILQVYAIEILKIQDQFLYRNLDLVNRVEIMAVNLGICWTMLLIVSFMLAKRIYESHNHRRILRFYNNSTTEQMKEASKANFIFAIKCGGFIFSFLCILDSLFYRIFCLPHYTVFNSNDNGVAYEDLRTIVIKIFVILAIDYVFTIIFPVIHKKILKGNTIKQTRLIWEGIIFCGTFVVGLVLIKNKGKLIIGFRAWYIFAWSVYMIWHRTYFMICDWIKGKYIQYRKTHKKKGGVKKC